MQDESQLASQQSAPDVLDQLVRWRDAGEPVALATVVSTWGSAPRRPGSLLAVTRAGRFEGSVSGGCVEGAVVEAAAQAIDTRTHALLDFGVTDEMAWEVGLACGGEMQVLVEPIAADSPQDDWLLALATARAAKRACVAAVNLENAARALIDPQQEAAGLDAELLQAAREAVDADAGRILETEAGRVFVQPFNPPLRLLIVGAVHIAQPLARMARESGYAVVVVDPRSAFATPERFPGVTLSHEWPDTALEALEIDARCAVVTLTHDPKLDDPALAVALRSHAFYVGSLGSRRTQGKRLERMQALGLEEEARARIHGPVGLDIGARSPAEIAVSILAEITEQLRLPSR